jgi:hypothetical protein
MGIDMTQQTIEELEKEIQSMADMEQAEKNKLYKSEEYVALEKEYNRLQKEEEKLNDKIDDIEENSGNKKFLDSGEYFIEYDRDHNNIKPKVLKAIEAKGVKLSALRIETIKRFVSDLIEKENKKQIRLHKKELTTMKARLKQIEKRADEIMDEQDKIIETSLVKALKNAIRAKNAELDWLESNKKTTPKASKARKDYHNKENQKFEKNKAAIAKAVMKL